LPLPAEISPFSTPKSCAAEQQTSLSLFLAEVRVLEALSWKDVAELLAGAGAFLAGVVQIAKFVREIRKQRARRRQ
jgi:hypothetical protein